MKITKNIIKIIAYIALICFITNFSLVENTKLHSSTNMHFGILKYNKHRNHQNTDTNNNNKPKLDNNNNNNNNNVNVNNKNITNKDLPDQPVYFKGWLKYFSYVPKEGSKAKHFFKNEAFETQQNQQTNTTKTSPDDEFGSFSIPDDTSFYTVAYIDRLVFNRGRQQGFLKSIDEFHIENMHNIYDDSHFKGSVKDLGSFSEGNCFEVSTVEPRSLFTFSETNSVPEGTPKNWLFCSNNADVKNKFMNLVIQLRLKKQHSVGLYLNKNDDNKPETISSLISHVPNQPDNLAKNDTVTVDSSNDGYWILLQDWSTCSKKCGTGEQFQHLMCVPPKKNGKACEGPALRTKPCNTEPCPQVHEAAKILGPKNNKEKLLKPIVRQMPISSRPLRYDKCHLKETDGVFCKGKDGMPFSSNLSKIPSRLVMNDKSLSVYTDDTLTTNLATFVLAKSELLRSANKPHCFILSSINVKAEICNLDSNPKLNFVEEWDYDFNLFKKQCHVDRPTVALDGKEEKELQDELSKQVEQAKLNIVKERAARVKRNIDTSSNKVKQTQEMTVRAIQKEVNLEALLEKEENEREAIEERELRLQLDKEKNKDDCLIKSIHQKELEDQYNLSKTKQEKEVEELKEEAKRQVLAKRQQIKYKISQMKKRANRKKKLLNNEILSLRNQVADQLNNLNHTGNADLCYKSTLATKKESDKYCNKNFADNPQKNIECMDLENYCYVCCENEFGNMHLKEREKCYDKCEDKKDNKDSNGRWQWVEDVN